MTADVQLTMSTMLVQTLLVLAVTTTEGTGQGCVNTCCHLCSGPDHCRVCYILNNNPVMCPCVGEAEQFRRSDQVITEASVSLSGHDLIRSRHSRVKRLVTMTRMTWNWKGTVRALSKLVLLR